MTNRIKGKRVIITGATSGIGEAMARQFAEMGCNLIITGRRRNRLVGLSDELIKNNDVSVANYAFDVRDRQACKDFAEQIDKQDIDILVNNAGLARGTDPIYDAEFDDWDTMIDTNVKGLLNLSRYIIPRMKKRNVGHVINIGSIASHESYAGGSVYAATKHAVKAITRATKLDLHGTRVRVSMISPGLVETEFSEVRFNGDKEKADRVYEGMVPLTGDDIAEIAIFVANRPTHVNIIDTIVFPVYQSSATTVYRDE